MAQNICWAFVRVWKYCVLLCMDVCQPFDTHTANWKYCSQVNFNNSKCTHAPSKLTLEYPYAPLRSLGIQQNFDEDFQNPITVRIIIQSHSSEAQHQFHFGWTFVSTSNRIQKCWIIELQVPERWYFPLFPHFTHSDLILWGWTVWACDSCT